MTIPIGFGQATILFGGDACPTGAAVTQGFVRDTTRTATADAATIQALWEGIVMPGMPNQLTLVGVLVKHGPDETGASGEVSSGDTGSLAVTAVTPNTSILVRKLTSLGGRRGRGRFFMPGLDENEADESGVILPARLASLQTTFTSLYDGMVTDQCSPTLLHDPAEIWVLDDGQPRRIPDPSAPAPPAPTTITSFEVANTLATQRRRMRR